MYCDSGDLCTALSCDQWNYDTTTTTAAAAAAAAAAITITTAFNFWTRKVGPKMPL